MKFEKYTIGITKGVTLEVARGAASSSSVRLLINHYPGIRSYGLGGIDLSVKLTESDSVRDGVTQIEEALTHIATCLREIREQLPPLEE